jgi:hypothetical protein
MMKPELMSLVKRVGLAVVWAVVMVTPAWGQDARLQITLSHLEAKASEVTDVTVDERMLKLGAAILSTHRSADEARVKELLKALQGVYVKILKFDQDGAYTTTDLDSLRSQLQAPGWMRVVNVQSKRGGENVEVYLMGEVDKIQGVAVIVADPHELVVANVVGPIDLEKISELEGHFGIPQLDLRLDIGRTRVKD